MNSTQFDAPLSLTCAQHLNAQAGCSLHLEPDTPVSAGFLDMYWARSSVVWSSIKRKPLVPELLNVRLQCFIACEEGVIVKQGPVKPALHLASNQGMVTHCSLCSIDSTHLCSYLQGLYDMLRLCLAHTLHEGQYMQLSAMEICVEVMPE